MADGNGTETTEAALRRIAAECVAVTAERDEAVREVRQHRQAFAVVEQLCASFDPTSGSGRARAFVSDVRVALDAAVTPAPQETEKPMTCTAAANIAGLHVPCELDAPHSGWAHSNKASRIIWDGPVTSTPIPQDEIMDCGCQGQCPEHNPLTPAPEAATERCAYGHTQPIANCCAPSGLQRATEQQQYRYQSDCVNRSVSVGDVQRATEQQQ